MGFRTTDETIANNDEALPSSYENCLLAVLCTRPEAVQIAARVTADLFSTPQARQIAQAAINHIQRYGRPPGVAHLRDLFKDDRRAGQELLQRYVAEIQQHQPWMNNDYVRDQLLDDFVATHPTPAASDKPQTPIKEPVHHIEQALSFEFGRIAVMLTRNAGRIGMAMFDNRSGAQHGQTVSITLKQARQIHGKLGDLLS